MNTTTEHRAVERDDNVDGRRPERTVTELAAHDFAVGRILPGVVLVGTWGYDQTNVDYFRCVERRHRKDGSTWAKVEKLQSVERDTQLWAQFEATPLTVPMEGTAAWRKVRTGHQGDEIIAWSDYEIVRVWNGAPHWGSRYA